MVLDVANVAGERSNERANVVGKASGEMRGQMKAMAKEYRDLVAEEKQTRDRLAVVVKRKDEIAGGYGALFGALKVMNDAENIAPNVGDFYRDQEVHPLDVPEPDATKGQVP